jgi:hypothetical protein
LVVADQQATVTWGWIIGAHSHIVPADAKLTGSQQDRIVMIFPSVTSVDGQADKLQDSMVERGAYARRLEKRSTLDWKGSR